MDMALRGTRMPPPGDLMAATILRRNIVGVRSRPAPNGRGAIVKRAVVARAQGVNSGVMAQSQGVGGQEGKLDGTQFMFHVQGGGQIRIFVREHLTKYIVNIEANLPDTFPGESPFLLHWGLSRSDSSDWVALEPESAPANTSFLSGKSEAMQTPMQQTSRLVQTIQLELPSDMAPFFVSFLLFKPASKESEDIWIRSNTGLNFCIPLGLHSGRPDPLGVTLEEDGFANFALYSANAANVTLCLYKPNDVEPAMEIDLQPITNKTGAIWHVRAPIGGFVSYGYRCKGEETWDNGNRFHKRRILLDPYAKFLAPFVPGQEELPSPAPAVGLLPTNMTTFDWEDDAPPCIPLERVIAYRLDVVKFTSHSSCGLDEGICGKFLGIINKILYFKTLGVNTIILQPIFAYDKLQGPYCPFSFFSPMDDLGPERNTVSASISFKEMVKALHKNGIELIMEVVYTHTSEKGDEDPETVSFRGIDNQTYYVLDKKKRNLPSKFGPANIFNTNHPAVHKMIVDSLRHWTEEYHVDGFSFVNASDLTKGPHGEDLSRPLLVETISFDPLLANAKLIAGSYSVAPSINEKFKFPHWKRWCEYNTNFQKDLIGFFRGDQGKLSDLATRICGSADMFSDGRGPGFSLNYITNGYELLTRTPSSENKEASTSRETPDIKSQLRNVLVTLFLSQGTPVINMGDEYELLEHDKSTHFDWRMLQSNMDIVHLISYLSLLRSQHKRLLQTHKYLNPKMIRWHGAKQQEQPEWTDPDSKFLAVTLTPSEQYENEICIAFNAEDDVVEVTLEEETPWLRIVDTSLPHPETIVIDGAELSSANPYKVQPCSVVVLSAVRNNDKTKELL